MVTVPTFWGRTFVLLPAKDSKGDAINIDNQEPKQSTNMGQCGSHVPRQNIASTCFYCINFYSIHTLKNKDITNTRLENQTNHDVRYDHDDNYTCVCIIFTYTHINIIVVVVDVTIIIVISIIIIILILYIYIYKFYNIYI